jgi:membrane fusion protein, multidrug efflux system
MPVLNFCYARHADNLLSGSLSAPVVTIIAPFAGIAPLSPVRSTLHDFQSPLNIELLLESILSVRSRVRQPEEDRMPKYGETTAQIQKRLIIPLWAIVACLLICGCDSSRATDKPDPVTDPGKQTAEETGNATSLLVVPVSKRHLKSMKQLPGQLLAFRDVAIQAKVEGYISWIGVDRGSAVKAGQQLIRISCPELDEKLREAEAKVAVAESTWRESQSRYQAELEHQSESRAQLEADELTASRLREASKTIGAVAQNDVDQALKRAEADRARIQAIAENVKAMADLVLSHKNHLRASENVLKSVQAMREYLTIRAPFDGVITERNVHEGSIVAAESGKADGPLLRIQQRDRLRLVVAVPETDVSGITEGQTLSFSVPAYLGRKFKGTIARPGFALDHNTRTMPVELDVNNSSKELSPGMYTIVNWNLSRSGESLFVPVSSVGTDLKGSYVITVRSNLTRRVPVTTGFPMDNLIEIEGALSGGENVLLDADDRVDAKLKGGVRLSTAQEIGKANKRIVATGE